MEADWDEGRVLSFFGPDLQKYTSFKAHSSTEGAIRQLLFNDRGVISIAAKSVHMSLRRGLAQWNIAYVPRPDRVSGRLPTE
ncbi:hypothetical protein GP486_003847 [Trichoglossum hirsutum]|uniref:Uncharacterized protein n=1 Tax=Trichoglossum hirsutum TaxID=265104 RepID=A0A9P8RQ35_9PEZI|nr:hypothetical protein GP486_003847 [Trichoglossum hirsutum]